MAPYEAAFPDFEPLAGRPRGARLMKTVAKALAVLRKFTPERKWLGVRELSRELGMNAATAHQILSTLAANGFVEQDPETKKYQLGLGLVELAGTKLAQLDLVTVAAPLLNKLMRETGETVNLAVLYGGQALYLAKVESSQPVRVAARIGGHAPLHCSAHGKALLAFAPPDVAAEVMAAPLARFTADTVTDPPALAGELAFIRDRGYAIDIGGYIDYLNAIAAPVRDHTGAVVASVGIVAPSQRMNAEALKQSLPLVLGCAHEISVGIGWSGNGEAAAPAPAGRALSPPPASEDG